MCVYALVRVYMYVSKRTCGVHVWCVCVCTITLLLRCTAGEYVVGSGLALWLVRCPLVKTHSLHVVAWICRSVALRLSTPRLHTCSTKTHAQTHTHTHKIKHTHTSCRHDSQSYPDMDPSQMEGEAEDGASHAIQPSGQLHLVLQVCMRFVWC